MKSLDVFADPSQEGVVFIEIDSAGRTEYLGQQQRKRLPKKCQMPASVVEETVKGIVGPRKKTGGKRQDACNGASGCAQDPAADQTQENLSGGNCENAKKMIDHLLPGRCNILIKHTDLHALRCFPLKTSVGRYACAQFSSSLAA